MFSLSIQFHLWEKEKKDHNKNDIMSEGQEGQGQGPPKPITAMLQAKKYSVTICNA